MQIDSELVDAIGTPLRPGQRVVFAVAGIHATGELTPGTITRLAHVQRSDGTWTERIDIRRDNGRRATIGWSRRILVLREEGEAEGWLRRRLAELKA